jgi:hypothetical protein
VGVIGCLPVVELWAGLSADPSPDSRAAKLHDFYFNGLPGFEPVVHVSHYGSNPGGLGQIRSNQFIDAPQWLLREFKLQRHCTTGGCTLTVVPVTDKVNPFYRLFDPTTTTAQASQLRDALVAAVPALAVADVNRFAWQPADALNAGDSMSQDQVLDTGEGDYLKAFGVGPSALRKALADRLTSLQLSLTPDNIVARAEALSCAGCHQRMGGRDVGGGLVWPRVFFVHVDDSRQEAGPDGPRFMLSDALSNVFLPHRQQVFEQVLNECAVVSSCCGVEICGNVCPEVWCSPEPPVD